MVKNYALSLIAFLCFVLSGYGQIATQSFEATGDTWTPLSFSTPACTNGADRWDYSTSLSSISPSDGSQFWGLADLNGDCGGTSWETITFPSYDVSVYTGVTITFDYNIIGFDTGDDLGYEIWEDGVRTANVDNLDDNTSGWNTITDNVNDLTSSVYLILKARNNGGGDYAGFDNIVLNGIPTSGNLITVTQATGGTISPSTTVVDDGDDQSFSATPDTCYTFTNWVVDGSNAGSTNPYIFTNVTTDYTITAVYTQDTYNITASAGANGSISPSGVTNVGCGDDQTYTITADGGYAVDDVLVDGVSVGSVTSHTFTNVTATHTISVTFVVYVGPCGSESFDNSNAPTGGSYSDGSFAGDNGVTWSYIESRDEDGDANGSGIDGGALMLRRSSSDSRVTSSAVPNGIEDFSVKLYKGFSGGGDRQVELFVNGISQGTSTPFNDFNEHIFSVTGINIAGNVIVELRNITGNQIIVDDIEWSCYSACIPTHSFTSMLPTSGPEDTEITVIGTSFTASTTASFGAISATVDFIDATTLIVHVPSGATTNTITLTEAACNIQTDTFTIIEGTGSCAGTLSDLIISQISDPNSGNEHYIEIYNGTGVAINLDAPTSDYEIQTYYNGNISGALGSGTPNTSSNFDFYMDLTGTIPNNTTWVISAGELGSLATYPAGDIIPFGFNENEVIYLYKNSNPLDIVGVANDNDWMNQAGISYSRNTDVTGPTTSFNETGDWTYSTSTSGIQAGLGSYVPDVTPKPAPTMSAITDASDCAILDYSVTATEGDIDTLGDLTYQWYFNNGVNDVWIPVTSTLPAGFTILGEDGDNLLMEGDANALSELAKHQFYCEVTEAGSCSNVSNAIKPNYNVVTWDGTWSSTPDMYSTVILDADYDTSVGGVQSSFSACNLIVKSGYLLQVQNGDYIQITNDIIADGDITVFTEGSVVQIENSATVTANGTITVQKQTTILNTAYDYTYWSSPVASETVENVFSTVPAGRRYIFDAANFIDLLDETNNTGTFTEGQDDIDDDGDDWQIASGTMIPGVGYAATPSTFGPTFPVAQQFQFIGPFNNGIITTPIVNNSGGVYNDWNFIGNPYPSAIDATIFFSVNSGVDDAIYLWNQATPANAAASGSQGLNFSTADYAVISGSGVNTAGGDLALIPNNFIPSGQGFFIEATSGANVTFNNSMRVTGGNNQFFRSSNTNNQRNILWLNLTSDNGVAKQIALAHLDGATDNNDGSYYDVKENLSTGSSATMYSNINDSEGEQFVIQGKSSSSLDLNEIIAIGFKTSITVPTLYKISIAQFEGNFYTNQIIYVKDNLLNSTHNLKDSDYTFTSGAGTFNDRFEIVFKSTTLSIDESVMDSNEVILTELQNGDIEIKVGQTHTIKHVDIMDITGRRIYSLPGNNSIEVYNLSKLSMAAYIAKITLSNGQVISKKAIKQK